MITFTPGERRLPSGMTWCAVYLLRFMENVSGLLRKEEFSKVERTCRKEMFISISRNRNLIF